MSTTQFSQEGLTDALAALGAILEHRGQSYDLVLIGASNLLLRGDITRPTKDGDLLAERTATGAVSYMARLPPTLAQAIREVAAAYGLSDEWLNLGPADLVRSGLPPGFEQRLTPIRFGSLTLWLAGRYDMLCFKLYAAADEWPSQGRHIQDLASLGPGQEELARAADWCRGQDPSTEFDELLAATLRALEAGPNG